MKGEFPLLSIIIALVVTTILLVAGQPFAKRFGWVDRPGPRKVHAKETPLIGGFAMFVGFSLALMPLELPWMTLEGIMMGCGGSLIVGYIDDMRNIRARIRFLLEFAFALWIIVEYEITIQSLGNLFGFGEVELGPWSVPFTMICMVGLINAINMSDGLDGQAGGQSMMTFLLMFWLAVQANRWHEAWILLLLVVVLVTFLLFNAPLPWFGRQAALVFMGDAGSMFLGFALLWFTVHLTSGSLNAMPPVTALWLVAVPLIDMFSSIMRRLIHHQKPFDADLGHMHHLLLRMGFSKGKVCLIMIGLTTLFGVAGIAGWRMGVPEVVMFLLLIVFFLLYGGFGIHFCKRYNNCIPETVQG